MVTSEEFKKLDEKDTESEEKEKNITEEIELKTELFKVKGSLKKNVTSDYTLAYINKDEREFITENYQNAEFAKSILLRFKDKGYKYVFDDANFDWKRNKDGVPEKFEINSDEKKYIQKLADRTFEFFMVRPHMISILGRNRSDNFLVKLLGNKGEEELEKPMMALDQKSFVDKMKDAFGREEVIDDID